MFCAYGDVSGGGTQWQTQCVGSREIAHDPNDKQSDPQCDVRCQENQASHA